MERLEVLQNRGEAQGKLRNHIFLPHTPGLSGFTHLPPRPVPLNQDQGQRARLSTTKTILAQRCAQSALVSYQHQERTRSKCHLGASRLHIEYNAQRETSRRHHRSLPSRRRILLRSTARYGGAGSPFVRGGRADTYDFHPQHSHPEWH